MLETVRSKREITIDEGESFYTIILEGKPHNMLQEAGISTLTSIL